MASREPAGRDPKGRDSRGRDRRRAYGLGWRAEALAVLALRLKGYRILARRLKTPVGEIDIVARRGRVLAIVEVKARPTLALALEALDLRQRARIARATAAFVAARPTSFVPQSGDSIRFDVMLVTRWRWPRHMANAWMADRPMAL